MARKDLIKYVKTDRNGTKYYYDFTCPRCGGMGYAEKWRFTGSVCFACGGSGERAVAKVVKEYTPEYWAKLEARRQARAAKYAEEHADEIAAEKAEQERREAEWKKEENVRSCRELGCGVDGIGYVLTGNTYPIKDQIKASGGRWISQVWVCPVEIKGKGTGAVKIDLNDFINEYGFIFTTKARDVIYDVGRGVAYDEAMKSATEYYKR